MAREYIDKLEKEGRAPATLKKLRWLIGQTEPMLSKRPVAQIETPDVLRLLRQVESKGTYETTSRLRSTIGSVFRYAIATGRAQKDPTEALKGALIRPQVRSRSAILDPKELGILLNRIDAFSGQPATKHALHLLALLAPRPGELRLATWGEFECQEATWRVPAERMKMRRPHRVPLPAQAIAQLKELHRHTRTSDLLFGAFEFHGYQRFWKVDAYDADYGWPYTNCFGETSKIATQRKDRKYSQPAASNPADLLTLSAGDIQLTGEHYLFEM